MIRLNLSSSERRAYHNALKHSRSVKCAVTLHNRNENEIASLTVPESWVLGGQVDVDVNTFPRRQLDLTVLDPKRKLVLDADAPSELSIFASTFVSVERMDWVEDLGGYVSCPVFWGPVTRFARNHPEITIEAGGKEMLALAPYLLLAGHNLNKGLKVTTGIRRVLNAVGETRYQMPSVSKELTHKMTIPRWSEPWLIAEKLARVADRKIFYDGRGKVRLEHRNKQSVWSFLPGEESMLLSVPDVSYEFTAFRNYVDGTGGIPRKGKTKAHAISTLKASNPLSPAALARNGVPRFAVEVFEESQILRNGPLQEMTDLRLKRLAEVGIDAQFDALPVPQLEEWDWVTTQGSEGNVVVQMKRWTIPLGNESMPVGQNRVQRWKMNIKHRRRRARQPWPGRRKPKRRSR